MNGRWANVRRIGFVVGMVVISGLATVIFWRPPSGSPAEAKVRAYVESPHQPEPSQLDGFGLDAIPFLIAAATNNQNSAFQKSLLFLLWKTPYSTRRFLPKLKDNQREAGKATVALHHVAESKPGAVSLLVSYLSHSNQIERAVVAFALVEATTSENSNLIPVLRENLKGESNAEVRVFLAWAMGRIIASEPMALTVLDAARNDTNRFIRSVATKAYNDISSGQRLRDNPQ